MQIDDFIARAASEPERTVTRTVWTTPPHLLAKAAASGGMRMTDLLSAPFAPGRRAEQRDVRYRHILGSPASQQAIDTWQGRHSSHALPTDIRVLVGRVNGVHLWANVETGRAYMS